MTTDTSPCAGTLGTLGCTREAGHAPGCVFVSSTGSDVDDGHADGGHG